MVFGSLFRAIIRPVTKTIRTSRQIRPTYSRSPPKQQFVKVIGEHRDKYGKSTKIHTLVPPKKTAVRDSIVRGVNPAKVIFSNKPQTIRTASTVGVQETRASGINLSGMIKTQPKIYRSPIIQETGGEITFKRARPKQPIEGYGKKIFGAHKVPMRPDNAFLFRPNNPKNTKFSLGQASELGVQSTSARGGKLVRGKKIGSGTFVQIDLGSGTGKMRVMPQYDKKFSQQANELFRDKLSRSQQGRLIGEQYGIGIKSTKKSKQLRQRQVNNIMEEANFAGRKPSLNVIEEVKDKGFRADIETSMFNKIKPDTVPLANVNRLSGNKSIFESMSESFKNVKDPFYKPNTDKVFRGIGLTARQKGSIISDDSTLRQLGLKGLPRSVTKSRSSQAESGFRNLDNPVELYGKVNRNGNPPIFTRTGTASMDSTGTFGAGLNDILRATKLTKSNKRFFENRGMTEFDKYF